MCLNRTVTTRSIRCCLSRGAKPTRAVTLRVSPSTPCREGLNRDDSELARHWLLVCGVLLGEFLMDLGHLTQGFGGFA